MIRVNPRVGSVYLLCKQLLTFVPDCSSLEEWTFIGRDLRDCVIVESGSIVVVIDVVTAPCDMFYVSIIEPVRGVLFFGCPLGWFDLNTEWLSSG